MADNQNENWAGGVSTYGPAGVGKVFHDWLDKVALRVRRKALCREAHRVGLRVRVTVTKDGTLDVLLWLGSEFRARLFLRSDARLQMALINARDAKTARHVVAVLSMAASRAVVTEMNPRKGDTLQDYTSPMRVGSRPACNGRPAGVVSVDVEN